MDSLNANYSFEYLGKDKGVNVGSFIDMRQMMWHPTVISSAEREAAYVIDGLMHNDVIKSDIHSTDTHGFSEIIFALTYLLDFEFAPRTKDVGRQQLFKRLNSYSKQHPMYRALKEFGKIPKTLFIWKYCDDLQFRQAIEKQLNKIEGSNKFSKAVSFGHNQEFI